MTKYYTFWEKNFVIKSCHVCSLSKKTTSHRKPLENHKKQLNITYIHMYKEWENLFKVHMYSIYAWLKKIWKFQLCIEFHYVWIFKYGFLCYIWLSFTINEDGIKGGSRLNSSKYVHDKSCQECRLLKNYHSSILWTICNLPSISSYKYWAHRIPCHFSYLIVFYGIIDVSLTWTSF